jgi:hypothetical protein
MPQRQPKRDAHTERTLTMPKRTGPTQNGQITVRWDRDVRGSADRAIMRIFAYRVTMALTGGTCPLTGKAFDPSQGEVDRADATKGYAPGNVVLTSKEGNQGRSALQSVNTDIADIVRYQADVLNASLTVTIPTGAEASAELTAWGKSDYRAAVENGPYGG